MKCPKHTTGGDPCYCNKTPVPPKELWKFIDGYERRYMVSSAGRVKSIGGLYPWGDTVRRIKGRIKSADRKGRITLYKSGVKKNHNIAVLMFEYWGVPIKVTQRKRPPGVPRSKLTIDDVKLILQLKGYLYAFEVGLKFDVSEGCIQDIWSKRTWKHVK